MKNFQPGEYYWSWASGCGKRSKLQPENLAAHWNNMLSILINLLIPISNSYMNNFRTTIILTPTKHVRINIHPFVISALECLHEKGYTTERKCSLELKFEFHN